MAVKYVIKNRIQYIGVNVEISRSEQWFEATGVPSAEHLPDEPKSTKWYQEIKFNPE